MYERPKAVPNRARGEKSENGAMFPSKIDPGARKKKERQAVGWFRGRKKRKK